LFREGTWHAVLSSLVIWRSAWRHGVFIQVCFGEELTGGVSYEAVACGIEIPRLIHEFFFSISSSLSRGIRRKALSYGHVYDYLFPFSFLLRCSPFTPIRKHFHNPFRLSRSPSFDQPYHSPSHTPTHRPSIPPHPPNISLPLPFNRRLLPSRFRYKRVNCKPS
jgi:hypothetical protein